ncbi:NADPH cytochrome P450 oxidoreductase family protein [Asticcacaulis sp. 201]|uniref:NADPH cytochrome P450 oxidoreductase family protein n=1 Tax=Asticcacaulis sp. 201 TaxID=3028787 RepID=UPI002916459B|nr:NADPH cytochrome P450 oxidoreductase family protein [Asticcacaulis sp. 201]MDV6330252.1 NADPH cytochrome P450 oxidoreductase family protein [Asticcacaulis sp. 201]
MIEGLTQDTGRLTAAVAWGALFAVTCLWAVVKRRSRGGGTSDIIVLHASQTGQAEEIARHAAKALSAGGRNVRAVSTSAVTGGQLQAAKYILCVASTTGEGDAPDEALTFERTLMAQRLDLSGRQIAVLALGDRNYDAFCAFGRRVFDWLTACGGVAIVPLIEADDLDAEALAQWRDVVASLGGQGWSDAKDTDATAQPWRLAARTRLNPDGDNPLYHLRFLSDAPVDWQAGDLVEIVTPNGHRRDYSLASLPDEGGIDLYVRQVVRDDGSPGYGSGLLINDLRPGDVLPMRVKAHRNFHAPDGVGPLLLVGAGSGLAGLRAHILQAAKAGRRVWLIYGERHPVRDGALAEAMRGWQVAGRFERLDLAFSRPDAGNGQYVQAVVTARGSDIPAFLGDDGAVMVCGGLYMGLGVEAALTALLGQAWVDAAKVSGRYRRDLY